MNADRSAMPFFGDLLDRTCAALNLYQDDLAKELGVTQQAASLWKKQGYVPRKRIEPLRLVLKEHLAKEEHADGLVEAMPTKEQKAARAALVAELDEVLAEMGTQLAGRLKDGIASIKAITDMKAQAEVIKARIDAQTAPIKEVMKQLDQANEPVRKALAQHHKAQETLKHFEDTYKGAANFLQEPVARRSRDLAIHEAGQRLDNRRLKQELVQLLRYLPGEQEVTEHVNGRDRQVDAIMNGAAIEIAYAQIGRNTIDWRPVMNRVFECAVLLRNRSVDRAFVFMPVFDSEMESNPELLDRVAFLIKDAEMLGVEFVPVAGEPRDIFAQIVERVTGKEFDPGLYDLPF